LLHNNERLTLSTNECPNHCCWEGQAYCDGPCPLDGPEEDGVITVVWDSRLSERECEKHKLERQLRAKK
jgi:hypothetical protein